MKVKAKIDARPHHLIAAVFGTDWNLEMERGDTKRVPSRYYNAYKVHPSLFEISKPPCRLCIWASKQLPKLSKGIRRRWSLIAAAIIILILVGTPW